MVAQIVEESTHSSSIFLQDLIIVRQRSDEENSMDVIEDMHPLSPLCFLSAHVEHSEKQQYYYHLHFHLINK